MAHYALIDENNIVTQVIVGKNENEKRDGKTVDWEEWYGDFHGLTCKRTSYNTFENEHRDGRKNPFRANYAGIGYTYDETNDVFIPPKPYESWILNESTWSWDSPVEYPSDDKDYTWNEDKKTWDILVGDEPNE